MLNNKELLQKHIVVDPAIQHGRPCIKGTRTPIHVILESLAIGMDFETVKKEFAPLTTEDIQACIFYAAILSDEQELLTQPA